MTVAEATAAETEKQLIDRAQQAVSLCNWDVGECAALWTRRFARGRTDSDFAQLVGLSSDQVYQRRRVWETFGDVRQHYSELKWSHFYVSLTWEDAAECLQWAQETGSTVAEMRAWRRAMRGEDLTQEADDDTAGWLTLEASEVRSPRQDDEGRTGDEAAAGSLRERDAVPVAAALARESSPSGEEYAPFSPDAMKPPATEASEHPRPAPSIEQLVRRLTTTMERCVAAINQDFVEQFSSVPDKDRSRFLKAAAALADKIEEVG